MLAASLASGAALKKFRELVAAQGGDERVVDEPIRLPQARLRAPLAAGRSGFVTAVDALDVALAAMRLGAGRARAEDRVDPAVGVSGLVKTGERVEAGAPLCILHANDERALAEAQSIMAEAIALGDAAPTPVPLVDEILG